MYTFKLLGDSCNSNNNIWVSCNPKDPYCKTPADFLISYILCDGYEPYGPWDFSPSEEVFNNLVLKGLKDITLVTDYGNGIPINIQVK